jgi:hypothetical protein
MIRIGTRPALRDVFFLSSRVSDEADERFLCIAVPLCHRHVVKFGSLGVALLNPGAVAVMIAHLILSVTVLAELPLNTRPPPPRGSV